MLFIRNGCAMPHTRLLACYIRITIAKYLGKRRSHDVIRRSMSNNKQLWIASFHVILTHGRGKAAYEFHSSWADVCVQVYANLSPSSGTMKTTNEIIPFRTLPLVRTDTYTNKLYVNYNHGIVMIVWHMLTAYSETGTNDNIEPKYDALVGLNRFSPVIVLC